MGRAQLSGKFRQFTVFFQIRGVGGNFDSAHVLGSFCWFGGQCCSGTDSNDSAEQAETGFQFSEIHRDHPFFIVNRYLLI